MKSNRNLVKTILVIFVGGLAMWIIAGLWHNLILPSLYEDTHATHKGIGLLLIAYFILAGFMAYLYPRLYNGKKPVLDGMKFGAIIGVLWVFPHEIAMAGAHETSIIFAIKNGVWHMVEQGIGGITIALTYQKI